MTYMRFQCSDCGDLLGCVEMGNYLPYTICPSCYQTAWQIDAIMKDHELKGKDDESY